MFFIFCINTWRPPTLPQSLPCSTIGLLLLNLRVRYGNGCTQQKHHHQIKFSYNLRITSSVSVTVVLIYVYVNSAPHSFTSLFCLILLKFKNNYIVLSKLHSDSNLILTTHYYVSFSHCSAHLRLCKLCSSLLHFLVLLATIKFENLSIRSSPRLISISQLNMLPCLHP